MIDDDVRARAEATLTAAREAGVMIVTCESCTGGMIGGALTAIAGSSDVVDGGYITYSNAAKVRLGVPAALIEAHGAVSEEVARAMAEAARQAAGAAPGLVSVAVTGVAGPGGGTAAKPVGLVHFAAAAAGATVHREARFGDIGRDEVRKATILEALSLLDGLLEPE
ncbi:CinA family protein [Acuticoccus yangtzensis]|uniref:CinA family protein n=1 Tax=Acuticoccus yangtzensis TaxID=1443441 RepID=UPI0009496BC3|nr:nicotinamide-nucleotide amidohydrolase family protein [Acuticoccus yangtzensis]